MKSRSLIFAIILACVCGCTDTINSVTLEYRNANNEALDAMMMVTNEETAKVMTMRVFKPLGERYKSLDTKLKIIDSNRTKKEMIKETFESDGTHMYLTELIVNQQRYSLERTRLRTIINHYADKKRQEMIEAGQEDPEVNLAEVCKSLYDLMRKDGILDQTIAKQLFEPPLFETYVKQFNMNKVDDYPKLWEAFRKRREAFQPKEPIILVY
jgi:hypothetical protein